ncbi:MAG TPA: hypothetical protein VLT85_11125, partial [Terriglobales bacterium]|nr:hypothetical protein [Terriglobales bacterium]
MRWVLRQPEPAAVERLQRELNLLPPLARLLALRGLSEPEAAARFLAPALSQLHSPYQMLGMERAA